MNDLGQLRTVVSKSYIYNLIRNQTGLSIRTITRGRFVSHNFFLDMNMAHESKSNKTPLYLIGELIGVPNTVMDSALHELRDRIDKDPKYKDVKNWLESLPKI